MCESAADVASLMGSEQSDRRPKSSGIVVGVTVRLMSIQPVPHHTLANDAIGRDLYQQHDAPT